MNILGIFARHPVPGRVKTRLARDTGDEAAAAIYAAFVETLLARTHSVTDRRVIAYDLDTDAAREWFTARAGGIADALWPQPPGTLTEKLRAFASEWHAGPNTRTVIIGTDSPTLPMESIDAAFEKLERCDVVLGPAMDGGYYLIGLRVLALQVFDGIEWSSERVLEQTVAQVRRLGLSLGLLPPWYDVDTLESLRFLRSHLVAMSVEENAPVYVRELLNRIEQVL